MPVIKKSAAPPPVVKKNSGRVGAQGGFQSKVKKDPSLRKRPILSPIYGEEILEPLIKKAKEIVVCFHPFTKNNYRISTEGKFIIERFLVQEVVTNEDGQQVLDIVNHWNLFYFENPLTDFDPPTEYSEFKEITYDIDENICERFDDFSNLKDLENKVIALVRAEFFKDRQNKLEELKENDKIFQAELERLKELEESENESATPNNEGIENFSESENSNELTEIKNDSEISPETPEETTNQNLSNEENRESAGTISE